MKKTTILVVDDESVVASALASALESEGYSAAWCTSAASALQKLRAGDLPDLLITDWLMPGMNGTEFLATTRRMYPRLPVIVISGEASFGDVDKMLPLRPDALLHKPEFTWDLLFATVERVLAGHQAAREPSGGFEASSTRTGVFVSYSRKDQKWLEMFLEHLAVLRGSGVEIWTDNDVEPGEPWHERIQQALDRARVAVLLVTPAFFASQYIANNELPKLLKAAEHHGLRVFWIPVSDSQYTDTDIAKFQAAHPPAKPLDKLRPGERNSAMVRIADKLRSLVER